jgi:hypothetical protein
MMPVNTLTPEELAAVNRSRNSHAQRYRWDDLRLPGAYFELTKTGSELNSLRACASAAARARGWTITVRTERLGSDLYQVRVIRTDGSMQPPAVARLSVTPRTTAKRYPWDTLQQAGDYFEMTKTGSELGALRAIASITAKKRGWRIAVKTEQICPDLYQVRVIRTA